MKRLNPKTNRPFRCGEFNLETGMVFRCYDLKRLRKDGTYVELWLTPVSFDGIKDKMRNRMRARRKESVIDFAPQNTPS